MSYIHAWNQNCKYLDSCSICKIITDAILKCQCGKVFTGNGSQKCLTYRHQQMLCVLSGDALPAYPCRHLQRLLAVGFLCLYSGLQQMSCKWIRLSQAVRNIPQFDPEMLFGYLPKPNLLLLYAVKLANKCQCAISFGNHTFWSLTQGSLTCEVWLFLFPSTLSMSCYRGLIFASLLSLSCAYSPLYSAQMGIGISMVSFSSFRAFANWVLGVLIGL